MLLMISRKTLQHVEKQTGVYELPFLICASVSNTSCTFVFFKKKKKRTGRYNLIIFEGTMKAVNSCSSTNKPNI